MRANARNQSTRRCWRCQNSKKSSDFEKPPPEFIDALNEVFRLEDVATQAGIRWGAVPAGQDAQELADMNEAEVVLVARRSPLS